MNLVSTNRANYIYEYFQTAKCRRHQGSLIFRGDLNIQRQVACSWIPANPNRLHAAFMAETLLKRFLSLQPLPSNVLCQAFCGAFVQCSCQDCAVPKASMKVARRHLPGSRSEGLHEPSQLPGVRAGSILCWNLIA